MQTMPVKMLHRSDIRKMRHYGTHMFYMSNTASHIILDDVDREHYRQGGWDPSAETEIK